MYFKTVSSYLLLSAFLIWFKLLYGQFGQSNKHSINLISAPNQPGSIRTTNEGTYELTDSLYTVPGRNFSSVRHT